MDDYQKKLWTVVGLIILAGIVLYFMGGFMGDQCVQIGDCKECWSTTPQEISSPLCANQTCTPEPYKVQHNAIVDVILCACDEYSNSEGQEREELGRAISEVFSQMNCPPDEQNCQRVADASAICQGQGLTKWSYE